MSGTKYTILGRVNSNWHIHRLVEYVYFQEGPGLRKWQWTDSGMKVINVTNILGDGTIDISNTNRYISLDEFNSKYKHFAIDDGDVVIASSGNTYGKIGRIKKEHLPLMLNTSVIRFKPLRDDNLDSEYLYTFLRSPFFKNQIEAYVIGSAQPNFGPTHLKQMYIIVPPFPIQQKIGAIISAFDYLIENNNRRIKILEEMAQLIYREWFVKFRFPGHDKVRIVESELGPIPEGWEVKRLGDILELAYGKALKKEERREGPIPVYGSSGIIGYHDKYLVKGPGIIVGRKGNVGNVFWSNENFYPIDTVFYVIAGIDLPYCYFVLKNQNFINNDSAVPGLNRNQAYLNYIIVPPKDLLLMFNNLIMPIFKQVYVLNKKNTILRRTRDLLLPKLISGELDVEELDIDVGSD